MKKPKSNYFLLTLTLITSGTLLLFLTTWATAQESSSTPIPTDKVQQLKDKLATKVAELRQSQTRGFAGSIAALSKTSFTLVTESSEIKVRIDENTTLYKTPDRKTAGAIADLKNGQTAAALGIYDADAKQLTARVILLQSLPTFTSGEITQIDKTNNATTIKTAKGDKIVDYEKNTIAFEYINNQMGKSGFSRFSSGDVVLVWGKPSENDESHISAAKIVRLPAELFTAASTTTGGSPTSSPRTSPRSSPRASASP